MTPAASVTLEVRLANSADVPALMALESRYHIGNLDPAQRGDGFVSVLHTAEWFQAAIASGGVHLADDENGILGFIAVTPPPARTDLEPPLVRAMVELAEVVDCEGMRIARQRYAVRGPVLIDSAARGRGVYSRFNAVTETAYADRYEIGVLFVADDNPRSLHTTTTKLGARDLAVFEVDGRAYHFLAYSFDTPNRSSSGHDAR